MIVDLLLHDSLPLRLDHNDLLRGLQLQRKKLEYSLSYLFSERRLVNREEAYVSHIHWSLNIFDKILT
jgi:hypothetical protein